MRQFQGNDWYWYEPIEGDRIRVQGGLWGPYKGMKIYRRCGEGVSYSKWDVVRDGEALGTLDSYEKAKEWVDIYVR